jgi:isopenicillin-N N-acyltransferase-like protein
MMTMRRRFGFLSVAVVLTALAATSCSSTGGKGTAAVQPTVPTVVLQGSPQQMGQAHGAALGPQIKMLHDQYIKQWIRSDTQRFMALSAATLFEAQMEPAHRIELNALAAAAKVDAKQTMLANCFLDLSPMTACSTLTLPASAAPDGVARFARNLDFPSFNLADNSTVLLIYKPDDKYAFASIGWPGLIGVLSGMNEHGLTLANMEVTRGQRLPTAMPYTMLYRTILEKCKTVDEAITLLRNTPRQTENNLMLMDAAGDRAVVEIYPDHIGVRRADKAQALISSNHRRCDRPDAVGLCSRYDALEESSRTQYGKIDVPALQSMLSRSAQGDMTLQSMVFEPSNRVMYLATGKNAPTKNFEKIDLKPLLQR